VQVKFIATGKSRSLPLRVEASLYRIAQEALTNVVRHARALHVTVQLETMLDNVRLIVQDDGRGFDPARIPQGRLGLIGLNERVKLLGGSLKVQSSPGAGTRIQVAIPLRER
jgi:signal transduction histidine kinase